MFEINSIRKEFLEVDRILSLSSKKRRTFTKQVIKLKEKVFEIDSKEIPRGWSYPLFIFQKTSNIYKANYWIKRKEKVFEIDPIRKGFLEVDCVVSSLYLPENVIQQWIKQVIKLKGKVFEIDSIQKGFLEVDRVVFSLYLQKDVEHLQSKLLD